MKVVLILMVKNESRILLRCLNSVKDIADAYVISDTGSSDNTCELAQEFLKTNEGCLVTSEWKNFGHNRTLSFQAAQKYVRDVLQWKLAETYGILLDGDMVFKPKSFDKHALTEIGYTIVQMAGNLVYPNCRLVRMDYNWVCKGVTHEYWDGPTTALSADVCYIDDRNDGGCKSDKLERDARLLEEGLEKEPDNVRYMFYLAQTYHGLRRWKDSILMYKRRINAGGWAEEVWYSHYMIGQCYLELRDPIRFEAWMLRAYKYRPSRSESLYKLTKYFREVSHHHKAYHYAQLGKAIPMSTDSLFVERDVYEGLFDYEITILHYYVSSDRKDGLSKSTKYLLKTNNDSVFANIQFYVQSIGRGTPLNIPRNFCGSDFHPSSVCMWDNQLANIRYVNYRLDPEKRTTYEMCENGVYSTSHTVRTKNVFYDMWKDKLTEMKDWSIDLPRRNCHIRGLEDVRVFPVSDGLRFTATTLEFSEKIRILTGKYDTATCSYKDSAILESPTGQDCEKNWLGVPHTNDMIYNWHPLQIGSVEGSSLNIHTTHKTPSFFQRMRGSAPPIRVRDQYWVMTHVVEYSSPRKYYHMFVILDATTYKPLSMSVPFVFEHPTVEYCLGMVLNNTIDCVYSVMDDTPKRISIEPKDLEYIDINEDCYLTTSL